MFDMYSIVFDIIIIGAGPAGLTAAIYAARSRLSVLVLEQDLLGGQAAKTHQILNFPGNSADITGAEMMDAWAEQARSFGAQIIRDTVVAIDTSTDIKHIVAKKREYKSKIVIIATGTSPKMLAVPGEKEYFAKGVSYCATCDAPLFSDRRVVVVGAGDAAVEESIYISRFASEVIVVVINEKGVLEANKFNSEQAFANPKISWIWNSAVVSIEGNGNTVNSIVVKALKTNIRSEVKADGVFIFIGSEPKTDIFKNSIKLTEKGYVLTDDLMHTSQKGVFAVGDVRDKCFRQVLTAAADGAIAAMASEKYLDGLGKR